MASCGILDEIPPCTILPEMDPRFTAIYCLPSMDIEVADEKNEAQSSDCAVKQVVEKSLNLSKVKVRSSPSKIKAGKAKACISQAVKGWNTDEMAALKGAYEAIVRRAGDKRMFFLDVSDGYHAQIEKTGAPIRRRTLISLSRAVGCVYGKSQFPRQQKNVYCLENIQYAKELKSNHELDECQKIRLFMKKFPYVHSVLGVRSLLAQKAWVQEADRLEQTDFTQIQQCVERGMKWKAIAKELGEQKQKTFLPEQVRCFYNNYLAKEHKYECRKLLVGERGEDL
jgi:hypothetical protein